MKKSQVALIFMSAIIYSQVSSAGWGGLPDIKVSDPVEDGRKALEDAARQAKEAAARATEATRLAEVARVAREAAAKAAELTRLEDIARATREAAAKAAEATRLEDIARATREAAAKAAEVTRLEDIARATREAAAKAAEVTRLEDIARVTREAAAKAPDPQGSVLEAIEILAGKGSGEPNGSEIPAEPVTGPASTQSQNGANTCVQQTDPNYGKIQENRRQLQQLVKELPETLTREEQMAKAIARLNSESSKMLKKRKDLVDFNKYKKQVSFTDQLTDKLERQLNDFRNVKQSNAELLADQNRKLVEGFFGELNELCKNSKNFFMDGLEAILFNIRDESLSDLLAIGSGVVSDASERIKVLKKSIEAARIELKGIDESSGKTDCVQK